MKINHLYVHLQRHETIWWEDVAVNGISAYVQYWIKLQSFESTPTRPLGSASAQNFSHFRLAPRFRFRHLSSTFSSILQLSSMALNRTTWRDEVTRLDAEVLTLKGILSTSNYSEVAEQQFSFHNPRGYAGPMAAASRQSRLPHTYPSLFTRTCPLQSRTAWSHTLSVLFLCMFQFGFLFIGIKARA